MANPYAQFHPELQSGPQPIQIAPADPMLPGKMQGQMLDNAKTQEEVTTAPLRRRLLETQITGAGVSQRLAGAKVAEAENAVKGLTPARIIELRDKLNSMRNMANSLGSLEKQYRENFAGRPVSRGFGLSEYFPSTLRPENGQFDAAANAMGPYIMGILGLNGKATDAAAEYKQKVLPFIPSRTDPDPVTASKLANLRRMLNTQREAVYKEMGAPYHREKGPDPLAPRAKSAPSRVIDFNSLPE